MSLTPAGQSRMIDLVSEDQKEAAPLQFDRVEGPAAPAAPTCHACGAVLVTEYLQWNGSLTCPACAQRLAAEGRAPLGKETIFRGFLYGGAAAVAGTILWFAVAKITGLEIGFIGIVIGDLVGRAIRRGAGNRGGRILQVMAVVMTYLSIVTSYVPDVARAVLTRAKTSEEPKQAKTPDVAVAAAGSNAAAPAGGAAKPGPSSSDPGPLVALAMILLFCLALAFIEPFLSAAQNIMGLIIFFFAL